MFIWCTASHKQYLGGGGEVTATGVTVDVYLVQHPTNSTWGGGVGHCHWCHCGCLSGAASHKQYLGGGGRSLPLVSLWMFIWCSIPQTVPGGGGHCHWCHCGCLSGTASPKQYLGGGVGHCHWCHCGCLSGAASHKQYLGGG